MPRQAAVQVENNFKGGFVTEASGLNFPENACTETENCIFSQDGSVQRRLGYDYEDRFTTKTIARNNSVIATYVWKNATGNGDVTLLVMQVGSTLYFYTTDRDAISNGALTTTVDLTTYKATGASNVNTREAQFADGNGFLFVTHPYCSPLRVEYDASTRNVTVHEVTIEIRDFEGVDDGLKVHKRPKPNPPHAHQIDPLHLYNLLNQGWTMDHLEDWCVILADKVGAPSNTDIMYLFKNIEDQFQPWKSKNEGGSGQAKDRDMRIDLMLGNTPAPKGHYILTLWDQDRKALGEEDGIKGLPSSINEDTGFQRPSCCAFFAGRVFWAGLAAQDYNSKIYFTQIIERDEQYGQCYQKQDPTAEELADLLADDGGVISIPEAGTIFKLYPIPGGMAVFAANGVWMIAGSTGLGFTAKDYTVTKLTSIAAMAPSSFVDVGGSIAWWNQEGIYILSAGQQGPEIQSLTDQRIKKYYDTIPMDSKMNARGYFNLTAGVIQWLFKSDENGGLDERYEYDSILNFNVLTSAFYVWTVPNHSVKIHGVCVFDGTVGSATFENVVDDDGVTVTDDASSEDVQIYRTVTSPVGQVFKYLVSNSNAFTFAESRSLTYTDWFSVNETAYSSYFISGGKLHGQGIRKFQSNYVRFYSRNDVSTRYRVQGVWDYANTPNLTSRWSVPQTVVHDNSRFDNMSKRLKIRGHGLALQLRVQSIAGEPFDLLGWSMLESANQLP